MSEKKSHLKDWYRTREGIYVFDAIDEKIQDKLSKLFGYYAIEIGQYLKKRSLLQQSRIKNNIKIYTSKSGSGADGIVAEPEFLPIVFDNVDLVIASHVFEG